MDDFLVELEQALPADLADRSAVVAMVRGHLQAADEAGSLGSAMAELGSPGDVAARIIADGQRHQHLEAVHLPNGLIVWAASLPTDGYGRSEQPDFGLYFDPRWQPPWPHKLVNWPDFGLPVDDGEFAAALRDVMRRAAEGATAEIGCLGAHGRTGTALGCLASLAGLEQDPVDWVRNQYCPRAVETDDQAAYTRRFQNVHGRNGR